jgi:2-polyprenyl-3-methyl-5-hydroxy-6-metoxy-1,4-benzoquinol methylase
MNPLIDDGHGNMIPLKYYSKERYIHQYNDVAGLRVHWTYYPQCMSIQRHRARIRGRVLEVGVNYGNTAILAATWPEVTEVVAVDIHHEALEACRGLARQVGVEQKMKFHVLNWAEPRCLGVDFDVFMCHHTLEHIFAEDVPEFVRNSASSVKPGGFALVTVPHLTCHCSPEHVVLYDEKKLVETFGQFGLVAESCVVIPEHGSIDGLFRKVTT